MWVGAVRANPLFRNNLCVRQSTFSGELMRYAGPDACSESNRVDFYRCRWARSGRRRFVFTQQAAPAEDAAARVFQCPADSMSGMRCSVRSPLRWEGRRNHVPALAAGGGVSASPEARGAATTTGASGTLIVLHSSKTPGGRSAEAGFRASRAAILPAWTGLPQAAPGRAPSAHGA